MIRYKIKDIVTLSSATLVPQKGVAYHLYSLPSFDEGKHREEVMGEDILSSKFVVPDKCILFNKLNVRFKRVWRIDNKDSNKLASTEFLPLIVDEEKVDFQYCYYLLISDSITKYLSGQNANTSGSHKRISPDDFLNIDVALPELTEQKKIGGFLSSIDQKIDVNRAINQNLEALAKQLYDYWFVQFDFPNEEGKPYKSSGGAMVWNEKLKKEIPAIWDVKMLRDITKDDDIKQINPQQQPQKVFKHLSFPSFDACGSYFEEEGESIRSNKTIVKSDYVLAAKLNPWIKRVAWGTKEADLICSTEFVVLNPSNSNTKAFLYEMVSQNAFIEYCTTSSTGTSHSQRRVKPDIMKMYQFPYNERVAELFSKHLLPLIEKSFSAIKQNKALVKLRDELLPLLMNGQITIE